MALGDIYEVKITQRLHSQQVMNVLHFREEAGGAGPIMLTEMIDAFIGASMKLLHSADLKYTFIETTPKVPYGAAGYVKVPTTAQGANPNPAAPGAIAAVISLRSAFVGRSKNGRIFIAGVPLQNLNQGLLDQDYQNKMAAFGADLFSVFGENIAVPKYTIGVWSEKLGGKGPLASPLGFTPIKSVRTSVIPASQYRRKIGVGS